MYVQIGAHDGSSLRRVHNKIIIIIINILRPCGYPRKSKLLYYIGFLVPNVDSLPGGIDNRTHTRKITTIPTIYSLYLP